MQKSPELKQNDFFAKMAAVREKKPEIISKLTQTEVELTSP